ncbi:hypothetical protein L6164_000470 [Bauhinia variegata]|uniref:Uncharacterized protein n=1 Tax=Bauhinia variegata TaxID=167791 RepID=A0ACB9Q6V3_BAUVA|nr:hypothetical protein L6164_000470 [Bauhinia variegata]
MINWAKLPLEILLIITKLLFSSEEFKALVAFGGVCSSWRSAWILLKKHLKKSSLKVVLLMLAEEELSSKRGFYSLSKCNIHYMNFPEAKGKQLFSFPEGWILTAGLDLELTLLHPFSHSQYKLPSWHFDSNVLFQAYFPNVNVITYCPNLITRAAITANPSRKPDFKIVITFDNGFESIVAFASPGDKAWTVLRKGTLMADVVCYKGKVHGIDWDGTFWLCDVEGSKPTLTKLFPKPEAYGYVKAVYLVESLGKLLAVYRKWVNEENGLTYKTIGFQVSELDWTNGSWTRVNSLGNRALLVGRNASFSVDASEVPGCEADSIYFTDDCRDAYWISIESNEFREKINSAIDHNGGNDIGVYSLKDRKIKTQFPCQLFSSISPPLWVVTAFP